MSGWTALRRAGPEVFGYAMRDGALVDHAAGLQEDAVLALLNMTGGPVLWIGDATQDALPAPVFPTNGKMLPGYSQATPRDRVSAWVRLRIAGFLTVHPGWDGVIATSDAGVRHWLLVSANEVVSTQGVLTPRLVAALGGANAPDRAAIDSSLSQPERLAAQLRSAEVREDTRAITGHLLGAELAATRPYWLGQQIAVIEDDPAPLAAALEAQGCRCQTTKTTDLIEPGLTAVGAALGFQD